MSEQFDDLAKEAASSAPRRRVLQGLGGFALGSLGLVGIDRVAEAKSCNRCKKQCRQRNKKHDKNKNCKKHCKKQCKNN